MPMWTLPPSVAGLLAGFAPCFTAPTFQTFAALACGFLAQTGPRTVTGMLLGARLSGVWSHDRAHAFFARARWSADQLGLGLVDLPFVPQRTLCLPVLARLWCPKRTATRLELGVELVRLLAERYPDRRVHLVCDAAYAGKALPALPSR